MVCLFSTAYLAPIHYYARLYHSTSSVIESHCNYVKQTYRNRCVIASANGPTALSIPIIKPTSLKSPTKDIRISDHDNWRHLHWNAIVSGYGNSPFFEYYRDDYEPFYKKRVEFLFDFNEQLRETTLRLLHLESDVWFTETYYNVEGGSIHDLREAIHPKKETSVCDPNYREIPYYQVFADKLGFTPNLSIIDLLFNMGPESLLVLQDSIKPDLSLKRD